MLCCAMLCSALLCSALLCSAMLCSPDRPTPTEGSAQPLSQCHRRAHHHWPSHGGRRIGDAESNMPAMFRGKLDSKIFKTMACWALFEGFGPLFQVMLGSRWYTAALFRVQVVIRSCWRAWRFVVHLFQRMLLEAFRRKVPFTERFQATRNGTLTIKILERPHM